MFHADEMGYIMSSKRQAIKIGSHYFLGTSMENISEVSEDYMGLACSNISGSLWNFYDKIDGKQEIVATVKYLPCIGMCTNNPRQI